MENLTILTTVIGASAATIGVVVAKDTKVSDFRLAWVEALREDVSRFATLIITINAGRRAFADKGHDAPSAEQFSVLVQESNQLAVRIRLRLDIRKESQQRLNMLCDETIKLTHAPHPLSEVSPRVKEVVDAASIVLNEAWTKVKIGEARFRWTFYFALGTLICSLIVMFVHWWINGHKL